MQISRTSRTWLKHAGLSLLATLGAVSTTALAQTTPTLSCAPGDSAAAPVNIATGPDFTWETQLGAAAAWIPATYLAKHSAWVNPIAGTTWIRHTSNVNTVSYRTSFAIDGSVDISSVAITISYSVDDNLTSSSLNGETISPALPTGGFGAITPTTSITIPSGGLAASNTLVLTTYNHSSPAGLDALITLTGECISTAGPVATEAKPVPIDSPWMLLASIFGLLAMGSRWMPRNR